MGSDDGWFSVWRINDGRQLPLVGFTPSGCVNDLEAKIFHMEDGSLKGVAVLLSGRSLHALELSGWPDSCVVVGDSRFVLRLRNCSHSINSYDKCNFVIPCRLNLLTEGYSLLVSNLSLNLADSRYIIGSYHGVLIKNWGDPLLDTNEYVYFLGSLMRSNTTQLLLLLY